MGFIDLISLAIMVPAAFYGVISLYFLTSGFFYFILGRMRKKDFKDLINDIRLGNNFIKSTKKLFWFTYTPLFAVVIMFRIALPLDGEQYGGYLIFSIIGYILLLLFSGYTRKDD